MIVGPSSFYAHKTNGKRYGTCWQIKGLRRLLPAFITPAHPAYVGAVKWVERGAVRRGVCAIASATDTADVFDLPWACPLPGHEPPGAQIGAMIAWAGKTTVSMVNQSVRFYVPSYIPVRVDRKCTSPTFGFVFTQALPVGEYLFLFAAI